MLSMALVAFTTLIIDSMFRALQYQDKVFETLDNYIDLLKEERNSADKVIELAQKNPDLDVPVPDFTKKVWEKLRDTKLLPSSRQDIDFSARRDGRNRPVPNVVLKVPTGGGKTWIAVNAISHIMGRYLDSNVGFVLWVVPNEAIYSQTRKNLKNRQHQYRQTLDRAASGKVIILEKEDSLHAQDIQNNLCVMLLMLSSSTRQDEDSLRMFHDRGNVHGFFPPEGEHKKHSEVIEKTPNLSHYEGIFPMVKDSLGNALRIIHPVVVLDEGHKATSQLAYKSLYGLNPSFVLELTATPKDVEPRGGKNPKEARYANVLVEVTGREVDREGMIKMPITLDTRQTANWKLTLNSAMDKLRKIEKSAKKFHANSNRYIRPIMLIQVERTGADQREANCIHADDVKSWLLTSGFKEAEIAVKTAKQNDLNQPGNQDLLSDKNQVRAIITKQALQEGWDCPFAYILCSLSASSSLNAMTQLVGRILRQPHAEKTGVSILDECHVVTHHVQTDVVVRKIKEGLEKNGLGDLTLKLPYDKGKPLPESDYMERRDKFKKLEIYLPKVLSVSNEVRELDYETDILSRIDWRNYNPDEVAKTIPKNAQKVQNQLQSIGFSKNRDEIFQSLEIDVNNKEIFFDPADATRKLFDLSSNPFVGREIIGKTLKKLRERKFSDATLGRLSELIINELRKNMSKWRDEISETLFKEEVRAKRIQFRLRTDGRGWRMPLYTEIGKSDEPRYLVNRSGQAIQKSLFEPIYEDGLNQYEKEVAVYLDGEETLKWWYRNVARNDYGIQGWRKNKVYPDFLFALNGDKKTERLMILETKGDYLGGNLDTKYKEELLSFLSEVFQRDEQTSVGELDLVTKKGTTVHAKLILIDGWNKDLPNWIESSREKFA